jgi:hypothetical protein
MTLRIEVSPIVLVLCVAITAFSQQDNKRTEVKFPQGDWSLTHPVISQLGIADAPARIISITGDAGKGLTITKVGLQNNSAKTISAVKFRWFLFRQDAPKKILKKGETPVVGVGDFPAGSEQVVEYPIVTFASIYQPFVKDNKLTGKFVIEIAVSEIQYADGLSWKRSE